MNILRAYNITIAAVLIVIYLALPSTLLAHAASLGDDVTSNPSIYSTSTTPCGDCPCSGGEHSDCCDTVSCNCACHAPLSRGVQLIYAPVVAMQNFREPSWSLAQVYRTIFVPPQNFV